MKADNQDLPDCVIKKQYHDQLYSEVIDAVKKNLKDRAIDRGYIGECDINSSSGIVLPVVVESVVDVVCGRLISLETQIKELQGVCHKTTDV